MQERTGVQSLYLMRLRFIMLSVSILAAVGCGGDDDEQDLQGDLFSLTAIVNGHAATGQMILAPAIATPLPNALDYRVLSFNLSNDQMRLRGQGSLDTITFDRSITLSLDAVIKPPNESVHLFGRGVTDSFVPLRFTGLRLSGEEIDIVLSATRALTK